MEKGQGRDDEGDGDGTQEEKVDKTEKKGKGLMLAMVTGWRG